MRFRSSSQFTLKKEIESCYQRQKCNPNTLLSEGIRFLPILVGVPWRGGLKTTVSWLLVISVTISSEPLELKPISRSAVSAFQCTLKCLTLNDFEMPYYAKICFRQNSERRSQILTLFLTQRGTLVYVYFLICFIRRKLKLFRVVISVRYVNS